MSRSLLPLADDLPKERADAARNRQRILDAAEQLFRGGNPEAVTMEQVAAAAGVSGLVILAAARWLVAGPLFSECLCLLLITPSSIGMARGQ